MQGQRYGFLKSLLLPILCAVYPVIFLYSHNVKIAQASSMVSPLIVMGVLVLVLFGLFLLLYRSALKAGLSVCVFLVFFYTYAAVYSRLVILNKVQVEHYTLVPFLSLCAVYAGYFLVKLSPQILRGLRDIVLLLATGLVVFNLVTAAPVEAQKYQARVSAEKAVQAAKMASVGAAANSPDIYFIIFDEYAGFDAMREYWKYDETGFISFLEQKGFYVAEHSHSYTTDTLHEIASRLNLKLYSTDKEDYNLLFKEIAHNKVMQLFKSYGYTTVVFDGPSLIYPGKIPVEADYNLEYDDPSESKNLTLAGDEFVTLFFDQTMALAFPNLYSLKGTADEPTRRMTLYSLEKAPNLPNVKTPKFIYLHVMLPHLPIVFDENGKAVDPKHSYDWNYYLGQHIYTDKRAEQLISEILANADPKRPPVIVLQSDHGARNTDSSVHGHAILQNYADKYKTSIMNALYLPGYDYSQLKKDQSPLDTFAIILNYYFHAGVTTDTSAGGN